MQTRAASGTEPARSAPAQFGGASRARVALALDPRFAGGTGSAVAAEVRALAGRVDLSVHGIETRMFRGRRVNPALERALDAAGIEIVWNARVVRADTVIFHNPSCLKFDDDLAVRFSCQRGFVVTHENFLRPGGAQGFDIDGCLERLRRAFVAEDVALAPVSPHNRRGVRDWRAATGADWEITDFDWFNICDHPVLPSNPAPRDRRGRHSRPGFEKFPPMEMMLRHFPAQAESCAILGADAFLSEGAPIPRNWSLHQFGEIDVAAFLRDIDVFVYFTHPLWRESFGRVIAEAIAAGKLVVTDPGTAEAFGDGVLAVEADDVDRAIEEHLARPELYAGRVRQAQEGLARFGPEAFVDMLLTRALPSGTRRHASM